MSEVPPGFLAPDRRYVATVYADASDAHRQTNPMKYRISSSLVDGRTRLRLPLAPGGGAAVSLKPATADDLKRLQPYGR